MSDYETHLYAIMYPNMALVASNLGPEDFGKHYTIGSSRYFHGNVVFLEIDPDYRHEYFQIEKLLPDVKPKPNGEPKRTKFICCYRVLEHIAMGAFKNLYVSSVEGNVLTIEPQPYDKEHDSGFIRTFQEICPLNAIVMTYMTPPEFGSFITNPNQPKSAPKVMFTQIELDIDEFLTLLEQNPFHESPIPNIHPQKLQQHIREIKAKPEKRIKGISLDSAFGRLPFLSLRTGFWIAHKEELLYYPIPDLVTLENEHYEWLRTVRRS